MKNKKGRFSGLATGVVLSFCLAFMGFIYAPIELYLTNQSEFWFSLKDILLPLALLAAALAVGISFGLFIMRLIGKRPFYICLCIEATLFVGFYIQGTMLVSNLPALDGTDICWSEYTGERIKSILAFVLPLGAFIFLLVKFKDRIFSKITLAVSVCITLILSITLGTLCACTPLENKKGQLTSTELNEFQLSTNNNVFVLMLDAVDYGVFAERLEANPEFYDCLKDFTSYSDCLASYPFTQMAVTTALTGQWFKHETSFNEYVDSSFDSSPLIQKLEAENYKIGIYNYEDFYLEAETYGDRFENMLAVEKSFPGEKAFLKLAVKMAGLKFSPWDLKSYSYDMPNYVNSICVTKDVTTKTFFWYSKDYYDTVNDSNPFSLTDENCFRFIHIDGAHVPFHYNKNMDEISDGTYETNVDGCLTIIRRTIERIKEAGVYDNSAIVIMADHGYDEEESGDLLKRMNPILLVKGIGETKTSYTVSDQPVETADFASACARLVDGKKSDEIFDNKETAERKFMIYHYTEESHIEEYATEGKANETEKMYPTGVIYEGDEKDNQT